MPCWCNGACPHIAAPAAALKQGQAPRAAMLLRGALTRAPFCLEGNLMLAGILSRSNHAQAAEIHIERAARYGAPARIAFERAAVLRQQMRLPEALPAFMAALQAAPDNPNVSAAFIGAVEMAGDLKEAKKLAAAARLSFPHDPEIRRAAATVADAMGDTKEAANLLNRDDLLPIEYLDRGRYLEKLGDYDGAWESWMTGKAIMRDKLGHRYNAEFFARHFAALAEAATPPRPDFVRAAPDLATDPGPLFICGFPRSGTTLLETILSSHSAVVAGDELMGVNDVIEALPAWCKVRVPYPAAMLATSLGENLLAPELLQDLYMKGARRRIGWTKKKGHKLPRYFTDKMPLNEIHLPLIRMLFPTAPVFRMQRHPLDVMVSCMSHWLAHGGYFASSLEACAVHYKAVDELMQHYKKQDGLKFSATTDLRYEDFVSDQEGSTRALCDYAGLPFEARCLTPQKNPRTARTLSYSQVRKPISAGSVGRWKNFRAWLDPAIEILRPIMEREGYEF